MSIRNGTATAMSATHAQTAHSQQKGSIMDTNANRNTAVYPSTIVVFAAADNNIERQARLAAEHWGAGLCTLETFAPYPTNPLLRQARLNWETNVPDMSPMLKDAPSTAEAQVVVVASSPCNGHLYPAVASWLKAQDGILPEYKLLTTAAGSANGALLDELKQLTKSGDCVAVSQGWNPQVIPASAERPGFTPDRPVAASAA